MNVKTNLIILILFFELNFIDITDSDSLDQNLQIENQELKLSNDNNKNDSYNNEYNNNNDKNDIEMSDSKSEISNDIYIEQQIDFDKRFYNNLNKKINQINQINQIKILNYDKISKKISSKRGPYRNYKNILSKNNKHLIIKQLINGKHGIITKIHNKTNIPKSTLRNWKINYNANQIHRGKYRQQGGGAKPLFNYQTEGNNLILIIFNIIVYFFNRNAL